MDTFSVSATAIDTQAQARDMVDDKAGAFASFEGWVRNKNEGHDVTALEYEVYHQLAISEGHKIIEEAVERFSITAARAVHREGLLAIGDCAIWIGVTAPHRGDAFAACRYIIDEAKRRLPVWKKEHYRARETQWVNCQHSDTHSDTYARRHHGHDHDDGASESEFYSRQTRLKEIGEDGQARLKQARVLVVGAGGLGSSAAIALAAAGIGTIGLVDHDVLEISNLHRQTLYAAGDVGKAKAELAAARLQSLNPFISVKAYKTRLHAENVAEIFSSHDIILDCTDNFKTKYLLNDAAIQHKKTLVQASIYQFEGQLLVIDGDQSRGCLRCIFPEAPPAGLVGDCAEAGVLGTVPAVFGSLQANEAIKKIIGLDILDELLLFDLTTLETQKIKWTKNPQCRICGEGMEEMAQEDIDYIVKQDDTMASLRENFKLVDVRESWEIALNPVEGAIHIPSSDFDDRELKFPKDTPLLLVCAKGMRSRAATDYLRSQGWSRAFNLDGGVPSLALLKAD